MTNRTRAADLTRLQMLLRRAAHLCQQNGDNRDAGEIIDELVVKLAVPSLQEVLARLSLLIDQAAKPRRARKPA